MYDSKIAVYTDSSGDKGDVNGQVPVESCRKLYPYSSREFKRKVLRNFLKRFFRGFSKGVVLYSGLRIITALIKNPFRESIPKISDGILSVDCLRVAAFFGLFPSIYHGLVEFITTVRKKNDGWTYGAAGGIAGLSITVLSKSTRQTLAFFALARALGAGVSTLVSRGIICAIPFIEVGVFSLCSSLILYGVVVQPSLLNRGYYRSILRWSRDYTEEILNTLYRTPSSTFMTCEEGGLHKGDCLQHGLADFFRSLPGFAKLYLPIHVTPVIVFKRKLLQERPFFVLKSLTKNIVLSTSFIGLMVALAKLTICLLRNHGHQPAPLAPFIPLASGVICGLALLLEQYKRRKELCLFVITHALNILYNAIKKSKFKFLLFMPNGFTVLFAVSMMPIMHAFEREPESLTLLINGLLKFFVGSRVKGGKLKLKQCL